MLEIFVGLEPIIDVLIEYEMHRKITATRQTTNNSKQQQLSSSTRMAITTTIAWKMNEKGKVKLIKLIY